MGKHADKRSDALPMDMQFTMRGMHTGLCYFEAEIDSKSDLRDC